MSTRPTVRSVAAAMLCGAVLAASSVQGAFATPVTPEVKMAERTNPAVQFIETRFSAKVSLREVDLNRDGLTLFRRGISKYAVGELRNPSDIVEYVFQRVRRNPDAYLREVGARRTKQYSDTYRGSGFVASPDGYVVTARHVVTAGDEVKKEFAAQGARAFSRADTRSWTKALGKYDLSDDALESISDTFSAYAATKVRVRMSPPKVSVILGTADADGSRIGKPYPAEVAYRSGTDLGEDVAVVRVHIDAQLPALPLATTEVVQGDHIYLNGFPALPDGSEAALLQPTLTDGRITALKDNGSGIRQPQTDATASGGSSGGPAFNDAGEVVGILVSGAVNGNGSSLGQNYLMPLGSVRDALARSGAKPEAGQTTTLYNEALDDFWNDHYSASLVKFRQVKDFFQAHAYAGSYIARAQAAIAQGKDVPVPTASSLPWLPIGIGVGVLLLGSGVALLVLRRPRLPHGGSSGGGGASQPDTPPSPADLSHPLPGWEQPQPQPPAVLDAAPAPVLHGESSGSGQPLPVASLDEDGPVGEVADDVDDIPEWEPIDYVSAFPTVDPAREEAR